MFSIAIDGPAGSGKSTIAKKVAKNLQEKGIDVIYVDTGAIYRAVAYFLMKNISISDINDEKMVEEACEYIDVKLAYENNVQNVWVNGENVTKYLRNEAVGNITSQIAAYPSVRKKLLNIQRNLAKINNVIMDGRDIGTNILPNATLKIFLEANIEVRARRRCLELDISSQEEFNKVLEDIRKRDYKDINRANAPMIKATDAVLIDTSDLQIEDVVSIVEGLYKEKVCAK